MGSENTRIPYEERSPRYSCKKGAQIKDADLQGEGI